VVGGGAAACGGACGGYDETTVLSYVGAGGDYIAETNYKYVGQGAGEFQMVTVPTNFRQGWCYCAVAVSLVVAVVFLLIPSDTVTTTAPDIVIPTTTLAPDLPTTTSEPYCCKSKGLWSLDKKAWCCHHYGVGCPTTAPPTKPPPTPPPEPNCAIGAPMSWDMGKKVWCCAHHHIGCPTVPPPPPTTATGWIPTSSETARSYASRAQAQVGGTGVRPRTKTIREDSLTMLYGDASLET